MATPGPDDAGSFMANLIEEAGLYVVLFDPDGSQHKVDTEVAANPSGFLPVLLKAADYLWAEASGGGLGVTLAEDAGALLGYRVDGMADVPFTVIAHALVHVIQKTRKGKVLSMNDVEAFATASRARAVACG